MRSMTDNFLGKCIAWAIIVTFSFNQLSLAADIGLYSVDNALDRQETDQVSSFSPDYIASQHKALENNISIMQDIEDFNSTAQSTSSSDSMDVEDELDLKNPAGTSVDGQIYEAFSAPVEPLAMEAASPEPTSLSILTDQGDTIYYEDNEISKIEKADGTIYDNAQFDEAGNLIDSVITFTDGTIHVIQQQKLVSMQLPDGEKFFYDENERLAKVMTSEGLEYEYAYITNVEDKVISIHVTSAEENIKYVYNVPETGNVQEIELFYIEKEKTKYYFDNNTISYIELADGKILRNVQFDSNNLLVSAQVFTADGHISYMDNGQINMIQGLDEDEFYLSREGEELYIIQKGFFTDPISSYQSCYSTESFDASLFPVFKTGFTFTGKENERMTTRASYYKSQDKNISLYFYVYKDAVTVNYSNYNYKTRQQIRDTQAIEMSFEKGQEYIVEYVWEQTSVNVYIHKESENRPSEPVYSIEDAAWDPKFYAYSNNVEFKLFNDSENFYKYSNQNTEMVVSKNMECLTDIKFNSNEGYWRYSLNWQKKGRYEYASIRYAATDEKVYLDRHIYNEETLQYESLTTELDISIDIAKTYQVKVKEDNGVLDISFNEKNAGEDNVDFQIGAIETISISSYGRNVTSEMKLYGQKKEFTFTDGKVSQITDLKRKEQDIIKYTYYQSQDFITASQYRAYELNGKYERYYINEAVDPYIATDISVDISLQQTTDNGYAYIRAYCSDYGDKYTYLTVSLREDLAEISSYYYDYKTRQRQSDRQIIPLAIEEDKIYTVKYIWTDSAIEVYVFEKGTVPVEPVYIYENSDWCPKFQIYGNSANITPSQELEEVATKYVSESTGYRQALKKDFSVVTDISFDPVKESSFRCNLYGDNGLQYENIGLRYQDNKLYLTSYRYDRIQGSSSNTERELAIEIDESKKYMLYTSLYKDVLRIFLFPEDAIGGPYLCALYFDHDDLRFSISGENADFNSQVQDSCKALDESQIQNLCPLNVEDVLVLEQELKDIAFDSSVHQEVLSALEGQLAYYNGKDLLAGYIDYVEQMYQQYGVLSSLVVEGGATIFYAGGKIAGIKQPDTGITYDLQDITFDQQGALTNYKVIGSDTSQHIYENGYLHKTIKPDTSYIIFDEEKRPLEICDATGLTEKRKYIYNYWGSVINTLVYNDTGVIDLLEGEIDLLEHIVPSKLKIANVTMDLANGDKIGYADGVMVSLKAENGVEFFFNADNTVSREKGSNGNMYIYENGRIKYVVSPDHIIYAFSSFERENGVEVCLNNVCFPGGNMSYFYDVNVIDDTLISHSLENDILFEKLASDQIVLKYVYDGNNTLKEMLLNDLSVVEIENGSIERLQDSLGKVITYSQNQELLGVDISKDDLQMTYDQSGNLAKMSDGQGTEFIYTNNELSTIMRADGAIISDIVLGEQGQMLCAKVTEENETEQYLENGQLTKKISPDKNTYVYQNDVLIKVITSAGDEYVVTLKTDDVLGEVYIYTRTDDKEIKYYRPEDELLLAIIDEFDYRTDYFYDSDKQIKRTTVTKGNECIENNLYIYDDEGLLTITSDDGSIMEFDEYNRLKRHTDKEGNVKTFTYSIELGGTSYDDITGENITPDISSFLPFIEEGALDGNISYYQDKDGLFSYYVDSQIRGVFDPHGEQIIEYIYDEGGKLQDIKMLKARDDVNEIIQDLINITGEEYDGAALELDQSHVDTETRLSELYENANNFIFKELSDLYSLKKEGTDQYYWELPVEEAMPLIFGSGKSAECITEGFLSYMLMVTDEQQIEIIDFLGLSEEISIPLDQTQILEKIALVQENDGKLINSTSIMLLRYLERYEGKVLDGGEIIAYNAIIDLLLDNMVIKNDELLQPSLFAIQKTAFIKGLDLVCVERETDSWFELEGTFAFQDGTFGTGDDYYNADSNMIFIEHVSDNIINVDGQQNAVVATALLYRNWYGHLQTGATYAVAPPFKDFILVDRTKAGNREIKDKDFMLSMRIGHTQASHSPLIGPFFGDGVLSSKPPITASETVGDACGYISPSTLKYPPSTRKKFFDAKKALNDSVFLNIDLINSDYASGPSEYTKSVFMEYLYNKYLNKETSFVETVKTKQYFGKSFSNIYGLQKETTEEYYWELPVEEAIPLIFGSEKSAECIIEGFLSYLLMVSDEEQLEIIEFLGLSEEITSKLTSEDIIDKIYFLQENEGKFFNSASATFAHYLNMNHRQDVEIGETIAYNAIIDVLLDNMSFKDNAFFQPSLFAVQKTALIKGVELACVNTETDSFFDLEGAFAFQTGAVHEGEYNYEGYSNMVFVEHVSNNVITVNGADPAVVLTSLGWKGGYLYYQKGVTWWGYPTYDNFILIEKNKIGDKTEKDKAFLMSTKVGCDTSANIPMRGPGFGNGCLRDEPSVAYDESLFEDYVSPSYEYSIETRKDIFDFQTILYSEEFLDYSLPAEAYLQLLSDNMSINKEKSHDILLSWQTDMLSQIRIQEEYALIDYYYKKHLGREASVDEAVFCIETLGADIDLIGDVLEGYIKTSDEYTQRQGFVNIVTTDVKDIINNYISLDTQHRIECLNGYGLVINDVVEISSETFAEIELWIDQQNFVFGNNAIAILKQFLSQSGVTVDLEELSQKAMIIEILTGNLNYESRSEFEISLFTLEKISAIFGVNVSGAIVDYEDIINSTESFISHIDADKYVLVTDVTDTQLTYTVFNGLTDPTKVTVSRDEFENVWSKTVLIKEPQTQTGLLNDFQLKSVKGGNFVMVLTRAVDQIINRLFGGSSSVVNIVTQFLNYFLFLTDHQKEDALSYFSLSLSDITDLTALKVSELSQWIKKRSASLFNCGADALSNLFSLLKSDPEYSQIGDIQYAQISAYNLLIDAFQDNLSENNEGIVETSFYAMQKTAESKGLLLDAQYNITLDEIRTFSDPCIVSLDVNNDGQGDHYGVVTEVTDTHVSLISSFGVSSVEQISISDFNAMFTGKALVVEGDKVPDKSLEDYLALNVLGGKGDDTPSTPQIEPIPTIVELDYVYDIIDNFLPKAANEVYAFCEDNISEIGKFSSEFVFNNSLVNMGFVSAAQCLDASEYGVNSGLWAIGEILDTPVTQNMFDGIWRDPRDIAVYEGDEPQFRIERDTATGTVTQYNIEGELVSQWKTDDTITYYLYGKIKQITDHDHKILYEYTYADEDDLNKDGDIGDLLSIDMKASKDELEKQIENAQLEVDKNINNVLEDLARDKGFVDADLRSRVNSRRNYIQNYIDELQTRRFVETVAYKSTWWGGKKAYKQVIEIPEVLEAINDLKQAQRDLEQEQINQLKAIEDDMEINISQIEQERLSAYEEVELQRIETLKSIRDQETIMLVMYYYRTILGRDPSGEYVKEQDGVDENNEIKYKYSISEGSELKYWVDKVQAEDFVDVNGLQVLASLNVPEIISELESTDPSSEFSLKTADKELIISSITDSLQQFLTDPNAVISELGLTEDEVVSLNNNEVEYFVNWLRKQSLHFGQSAFINFMLILEENGVDTTSEEVTISSKLILVDILAGVIDVRTTGDLKISMFALDKVAKNYGVTDLVCSQLKTDDGSLSLEELKRMVSDGQSVMTIIDGSHFVLVRSIDEDGTVHYFEANAGANGTEKTIDQETFLESWSGYVMSNDVPLIDKGDVLSIEEMKEVTGAFFEWVVWIAITAFALSFIDNQITQIISTILGFVTLALSVANLALNLFNGSILTSIKEGFATFKAFCSEGFTKIGSFVSSIGGKIVEVGNKIGEHIWNAIATTSYNMTINRSLTQLGMPSGLANIGSAFLTGGFCDGFTVGATEEAVKFSVAGALQGATIAGVGYLGDELDLDPGLTSILGTSAGALVYAGFGGIVVPKGTEVFKDGLSIKLNVDTPLYGIEGIGYAMGTVVLPNLASELSYYGITKLAEELGLDPRISQIAGMGIRSSIRSGLNNSGTIWEDAMTGIAQGVASVGINYAIDELDLDPLLGNLAFSAIATGIEAMVMREDIFEHMFETYKENAVNMLGVQTPDRNSPLFYDLVDGSTVFNNQRYQQAWNQYYWQKSVYMGQLIDFTNIAVNQGIDVALNTYAIGLFNGIATNAIVNIAKISLDNIGSYIKDKVDTHEQTPELPSDVEEEINESGNIEYKVPIKDESTGEVAMYAILEKVVNPETGQTYLKFKGYDVPSQFKMMAEDWMIDLDDNSVKGMDGYIREVIDGYEEFQGIDMLGNQDYYAVTDPQGNVVLIVEPTQDGGYNTFNSYGEYIDAKITNNLVDMESVLSSEQLSNSEMVISGELFQELANTLDLQVGADLSKDYSINLNAGLDNKSLGVEIVTLDTNSGNSVIQDSDLMNSLRGLENAIENIVDDPTLRGVESVVGMVDNVRDMMAGGLLVTGGSIAGAGSVGTLTPISAPAVVLGSSLFLYGSLGFFENYNHFVGYITNNADLMDYSWADSLLGERYGTVVDAIEQIDAVHDYITQPMTAGVKQTVETTGKGILSLLRLVISGIESI